MGKSNFQQDYFYKANFDGFSNKLFYKLLKKCRKKLAI